MSWIWRWFFADRKRFLDLDLIVSRFVEFALFDCLEMKSFGGLCKLLMETPGTFEENYGI
jgi:hypothetical protein